MVDDIVVALSSVPSRDLKTLSEQKDNTPCTEGCTRFVLVCCEGYPSRTHPPFEGVSRRMRPGRDDDISHGV